MTVSEMTLSDLIAKCIQYPNNYYYADQILELNSRLNAGQISSAEFVVSLEKFTGKSVTPVYSRAGNILTYTLNDTVSTTTSGINSNVQNIARSNVRSVVNTGVANNVATTGRVLTPAMAGSNWAYIANSVASPIAAAATGISLGKLIDGALYNLNPDFWNANGMWSINPETWNTITMGVDYTDPVTGAAATAFNFIFGLDPDNNAAQAYMDETTYAYLATYLNSMGVFNEAGYEATNNEITVAGVSQPAPTGKDYRYDYYSQTLGHYYDYIIDIPQDVWCYIINGGPNDAFICFCSQNPNKQVTAYGKDNSNPEHNIYYKLTRSYTYNGRTVYYQYAHKYNLNIDPSSGRAYAYLIGPYAGTGDTDTIQKAAWLIAYGTITEQQAIEGISNQPGATLPDTTGWNDIPSTLSSLQTQYPDLWQNAIDYGVIQPDGTVENKKAIPVPWPLAIDNKDLQPVSGDSTQANPTVSPDTSTQELIDFLTKILVNPSPDPFTDTEQPPDNPTDTGDGTSPTPTPITGSASSMWAIYHPTQSQVDDFGAWLWSPDFIDQIAKIFNNPMESIIGLHKIFATPIDAGQSTIKVGYLDSEVPSAYITQQYVYVDCGTIDLFEEFGNVFDYSPYTSVNLYLPFIGIVPLDVADVMRASISITYGVDVITGACLAMVEVSRDAQSSIQYQYSGNCAVQYPISSGSYMGIVASIISVAGSIVATAASGGAAAPLALGAAGAALNAHTQVQHSGSYSGNAGAMGGKIPYLIISRPITKMANNFNDFSGYPTNAYITVGECEGYIKANEAHIININGTEDELNEIYSLLIGGVII